MNSFFGVNLKKDQKEESLLIEQTDHGTVNAIVEELNDIMLPDDEKDADKGYMPMNDKM